MSRPFSFVTMTRPNPDLDRPLELLAQSMRAGGFAQRELSTGTWSGGVVLAQEDFASPFPTHSQRVEP